MFEDVLLTVDFDRTLTDCSGKIPERNFQAIRYFMENGGTFTVNTGRSIPSFSPFMDVVPVNAPILLYNGSAAYYHGKLTDKSIIDLDMWQVLHTLGEEFPHLNIEIQGVDNHYLVNGKPNLCKLYDQMGWPYQQAQEGQDLGPFLKFSVVGTPEVPEIASWFEATPEEIEEFDRIDERVQALYGDKVVTFRAAARILDVHAKGVSKNKAARNLQKKLGKKILVCVGDAKNDLAMLEGADYSFCPADGVVADRFPNVCPCGEGAVADVIYKKIPEILGITLDKQGNVC